MINEVIRFQNDIAIVLNERGEQIPTFQGRYEVVKAKILAHAPASAKFSHGIWLYGVESANPHWYVSGNAIPRKDW